MSPSTLRLTRGLAEPRGRFVVPDDSSALDLYLGAIPFRVALAFCVGKADLVAGNAPSARVGAGWRMA